MRKLVFMILACALFAGCATYRIPKGYTGPTAVVSDTGTQVNATKGEFFVLSEIDGVYVRNSLGATRDASYGQTFFLSPVFVKRPVEARPMKVEIIGTHEVAAPIQAMVEEAAGTLHRVRGEVEFRPAPGGSYCVTGELKKGGGSSVWIEDARTGERVTDIVSPGRTQGAAVKQVPVGGGGRRIGTSTLPSPAAVITFSCGSKYAGKGPGLDIGSASSRWEEKSGDPIHRLGGAGFFDGRILPGTPSHLPATKPTLKCLPLASSKGNQNKILKSNYWWPKCAAPRQSLLPAVSTSCLSIRHRKPQQGRKTWATLLTT